MSQEQRVCRGAPRIPLINSEAVAPGRSLAHLYPDRPHPETSKRWGFRRISEQRDPTVLFVASPRPKGSIYISLFSTHHTMSTLSFQWGVFWDLLEPLRWMCHCPRLFHLSPARTCTPRRFQYSLAQGLEIPNASGLQVQPGLFMFPFDQFLSHTSFVIAGPIWVPKAVSESSNTWEVWRNLGENFVAFVILEHWPPRFLVSF